MTVDEVHAELPEEDIAAKWLEIAPGIDKMATRIQDPGDFPVSRGSSLSGDDTHSAPYCVSHAVRSCLVSGVDHLHAAKCLVLDLQVLHASAVYSLIRGSLENLAAAYWMLHPTRRNDRIERTLRWHAKNFKDQASALQPLGLADESTREAKLSRLDAIAVQRGIAVSDVRSGYFSSTAVRYVDKHSPVSAPLLPWQVCSGFAHGRPWAVLGMSEQEQYESADPTVVNLRLTSDLSRVLYPTLSAFRLMVEVVGLLQQRSSPAIETQR
ncbi:hypothetical protein [Mycolicibacterium mucogenicum]|uniref:hypothetical protein n=1 Tax=Mycolicibacterium mucogenicum TaxID=56689 RepID=UPI0013A57CDF|nr:hypothetical protein [Mycolicibacterium mucogenicum]